MAPLEAWSLGTEKGYTRFFFFYILYNTVLVLPYINMNPPQVYTLMKQMPNMTPKRTPHEKYPVSTYLARTGGNFG